MGSCEAYRDQTHLHNNIACSRINSTANSCPEQSCSSLSWRQQKHKEPPLASCCPQTPPLSWQLEQLKEGRESTCPTWALSLPASPARVPSPGLPGPARALPAQVSQARIPMQHPVLWCPVPLPCSEPTHICLSAWTSSGCLPGMRPHCSWSTTTPAATRTGSASVTQAEPGEELVEIYLCVMEQLCQNNAFPTTILFDLHLYT